MPLKNGHSHLLQNLQRLKGAILWTATTNEGKKLTFLTHERVHGLNVSHRSWQLASAKTPTVLAACAYASISATRCTYSLVLVKADAASPSPREETAAFAVTPTTISAREGASCRRTRIAITLSLVWDFPSKDGQRLTRAKKKKTNKGLVKHNPIRAFHTAD